MSGLEILALIVVAAQMIFTIQVINNVHYVIKKYKKPRETVRPKAALIVPCKGLDDAFEKNILSFFEQDYKPYTLLFVVQEQEDPIYPILTRLIEQNRSNTRAQNVRLLIAGRTEKCSQKLHNLLYAYQQIDPDTEILAFADSDACLSPRWLAYMAYPLRESHKNENGAATGYRWFVPITPNFATLTLSGVNAKIAQLLGNTHFNLAWGGSMAIRVDNFRRLKLDQIWTTALSDDLSLSAAVSQAHLKLKFIPACMVASYEAVTWKELWEFGRRQFIITRIYRPGMWLFGLISALFSVFGLWGGIAAACCSFVSLHPSWILIAWPFLFAAAQWLHAFLRQWTIGLLLAKDKAQIKPAARADLLLFWFFSIILLIILISSSVGKTICWRGMRYRLNSPTDIEIIKQ
jgi:cellulose synthase/poly-beta-1,6-N-acetylglucosamine synthase-like glycosyltransferase